MKKLLGILGTITIAGSGMAGLVGNAPTKKEINYLQTNNSENLSRVKRWNPIDWTIQAGKDVGNAVATGAKTVATVVVKGAEAAADIASNCLGSPDKIVNTAKKFVTNYEAGTAGAAAGGTIGGTIGSAVPGIGTVIGAGGGALIGAGLATTAQTARQCGNIK